MVEALVSDLDNVDERARSTIEGIGGARPFRTAAAAPPTKRAFRTSRPPKWTRSELRLDDLLNEAPQPVNEPPSRTATIEAALQALEARIDDAKARLSSERRSHAQMPASSAADQIGEQIERIEGRLNEIAGRLPPPGDSDLASAIREISAHQRTIDDRAEAMALRRDQKALTAAMAALRADIVSLTRQVNVISRNGAADQGAMVDLAQRIDALAAERPFDRDAVQEIRTDLAALRTAIAENAERSSAGEIEERLNDFLSADPGPVADRRAGRGSVGPSSDARGQPGSRAPFRVWKRASVSWPSALTRRWPIARPRSAGRSTSFRTASTP